MLDADAVQRSLEVATGIYIFDTLIFLDNSAERSQETDG